MFYLEEFSFSYNGNITKRMASQSLPLTITENLSFQSDNTPTETTIAYKEKQY